MEKGDKVLCKRSLPTANGPIIEKGVRYEVLFVSTLQVKISCNMNRNYFVFGLVSFSNTHQFSDYFYTEKETRKLKLERIIRNNKN